MSKREIEPTFETAGDLKAEVDRLVEMNAQSDADRLGADGPETSPCARLALACEDASRALTYFAAAVRALPDFEPES